MGIFYSVLFGNEDKKQFRLCILGLASSGKSTLTNKIILNEIVFTVPTIGMDYRRLEMPRFILEMFDIGGQDRLRALWPALTYRADIIWYLIDASDPGGINESIQIMLQTLCVEELGSVCICVLLSKTDLPGSVTKDQFSNMFSLDSLPQHQKIVYEVSSITGNGIKSLLDWTSRRCVSELGSTYFGRFGFG